jgi:hypothetical protein
MGVKVKRKLRKGKVRSTSGSSHTYRDGAEARCDFEAEADVPLVAVRVL